MKYLTIPYFYDETNTHILPIKWIPIDKKTKIFFWNDSLFTVKLIYTKNNVNGYIHNNYSHYISHFHAYTISEVIFEIILELDHIVNYIILKNKYNCGVLHDIPLYKLYDLIPSSPIITEEDYPF